MTDIHAPTIREQGKLGGRKRGKVMNMEDVADLLDKATILALKACIEVLSYQVPRQHRQYVRHQKVRSATAGIVLNTAVRVDEQRLRKKIVDRWPALAKLLLEEERKMRAIDVTPIDVDQEVGTPSSLIQTHKS